MRHVACQVQQHSNAGPESGRLSWSQILCFIDLIHISMTRGLFVLKLGVELEQVTKVLHVLVVHLHGDPAIILHGHSALQKAELITRLLKVLCGDCINLFEAFHQTFHHKLLLADNQNVIHMDKNNAAAVGILENAWVRLVH